MFGTFIFFSGEKKKCSSNSQQSKKYDSGKTDSVWFVGVGQNFHSGGALFSFGLALYIFRENACREKKKTKGKFKIVSYMGTNIID